MAIRFEVFRLLFKGLTGAKVRNGEAINNIKEKRKIAEDKISGMVAQLNGCGDRWFLAPKSSIDDCLNNNGD